MSHNYYRKTNGEWTNGDAFAHADATFFDQTLAKQVNGDEGGTWAPTAPIIISGSGLQFSKLTRPVVSSATGTIHKRVVASKVDAGTVDYGIADGDLFLAINLDASPAYRLKTAGAFEGATLTIALHSATSTSKTLYVTTMADVTLVLLSTFQGYARSVRFVFHSGAWVPFHTSSTYDKLLPVVIRDAQTLGFQGTGHVRWRLKSHAVGALEFNQDNTFAVSGADILWVDQELSAARAYTLSASGADSGDVIEMATDPAETTGGYLINVKDHDGSAIHSFHGPTSTTDAGVRLVFNYDHWVLLSTTRFDTQ